MLRVLDLFSEGQDPLVGSASGREGHDRSGTVSKPSQVSCSCWIAMRHCGDTLGGAQYLGRDALRTTGTREVRQGTWNRSGSGSRRGLASRRPSHNKLPSALGSACRTSTGFPERSGLNIRQSNATGLRRTCFQARTVSRTGGSAAVKARQPSSAAIGISLCNLSNTTSTWRGQQHTRCRKTRSVS